MFQENRYIQIQIYFQKNIQLSKAVTFIFTYIYYKFQRPILVGTLFDCLSCLARKQLSELRRWTNQFLFIKYQDYDRSNVSTGGPWELHLDRIGLERV